MKTSPQILLTAALLFTGVTAWSQRTLPCSSEDGHRHYCNADTHNGVQMSRQRSGSVCTEGYSWGADGRGIWVDHGCRADFVVQNGSNPGYGGTGRIVSCSSDDGGRHHCDAITQSGVEMVRQRSGSPCTEGYSWGADDRGIWVDHGCRADFSLPGVAPPNPIPDRGSNWNQSGGRTLTCSSEDGHRHYCNADSRAGVQMVHQLSGSACTEGYSWGSDDRGVWVDHGCRADFVVGRGGNISDDNSEADGACSITLGDRRANQLADQCTQVSTGSHPPCNVQNSCRTIRNEIRRGCSLIGSNAPSFCNAYR